MCLLLEEAISLLLWRAYDCGVKGVSDAIHHCRTNNQIPGAKAMMKSGTHDKLAWLLKHDRLPLDPHQREGTYLVKRKKVCVGRDPRTDTEVLCLRTRIEHVPGNLIRLWKDDQLFPPDDDLENDKDTPPLKKPKTTT